MRTSFVETLLTLAAEDERIWLICGDLGYSVLEPFARAFPGRYVNAGVAEQNMTGVAAGLALSGKVVFTYSIANFPVMRCLEQVRNDICYHNLNVKIVAVGGGLTYGSAGYTHHGVEDLAITRALPNLAVLAPGDPWEAQALTAEAARHAGPCYLRLGKAGERRIHSGPVPLAIGRAVEVRPGDDVTFVSCGGVLPLVMDVAESLGARGVSAGVLSMPTLKPLDAQAVLHAARRTGRIVTVEEHGLGGLGSAVAEVLAEAGGARLRRVRLRESPLTGGGSQESLRALGGVSQESLTGAAFALLERESR